MGGGRRGRRRGGGIGATASCETAGVLLGVRRSHRRLPALFLLLSPLAMEGPGTLPEVDGEESVGADGRSLDGSGMLGRSEVSFPMEAEVGVEVEMDGGSVVVVAVVVVVMVVVVMMVVVG